MSVLSKLLKLLAYLLATGGIVVVSVLIFLYIDAHRDRDSWLAQRHGLLVHANVEAEVAESPLSSERVRLRSDTGLEVSVRVLRPSAPVTPVPVLLVLGGHRTGADAVELFDGADDLAIVALNYPYEGPARPRGFVENMAALPSMREAFLDVSPALSLTVDWVLQQPWSDARRVVLAGVSLGVPFAATAAARDQRISALMLVHGAADNRKWMRHNIALRADLGPLLSPASYVFDWLAYGPLHDTPKHVAMLSPRTVIIVGAREDERSPPGQTESLFASAGEPRKLLWTEGRHVQPGRREIIEGLMTILRKELPGLHNATNSRATEDR